MRTSVVRFAVSAIALASMAALLVIILDHLAPGGSETTVRRTASYLASNGASAGFAILFAGGAVLAALARSFTLALALLPTLMLVFAPLIIGQAQDVSDQVYVPKDAIVLFLGDKDASPTPSVARLDGMKSWSWLARCRSGRGKASSRAA